MMPSFKWIHPDDTTMKRQPLSNHSQCCADRVGTEATLGSSSKKKTFADRLSAGSRPRDNCLRTQCPRTTVRGTSARGTGCPRNSCPQEVFRGKTSADRHSGGHCPRDSTFLFFQFFLFLFLKNIQFFNSASGRRHYAMTTTASSWHSTASASAS